MERLNLLLGFLLLYSVVLQLEPVVQGLHIYRTFSPSPDVVLNHLSVDNQTGKVYIGAVDNLYQLNRQLDEEKTVSTGPRLDSVNCPGPDEEGDTTCPDRVDTSNVNKVLAIDLQRSQLITCGSVYHGICEVRNLRDISQISVTYTPGSSKYVATNSPSRTTVGFVAPGPQPHEETALYVGSTYGEQSVIRQSVPAVSVRSLQSSEIFEIMNGGEAKFFVNPEDMRPQYLISYIHGFHSKNHVYFATFQLEGVPQPGDLPPPYWSKLIRLCVGDINFYSYMEIPLKCIGQNGTNYNLLQAMYVSKPGQKLAQSMGLEEDDEMLFGVFSASKTPSGMEPLESSALCIYPLSEVNEEFSKVQEACYTQEGGEGGQRVAEPLAFARGSRCTNFASDIMRLYPCGDSFTPTKFGGTEPLTHTAVAEFPVTGVTSVAASTVNGYTAAFLGTTNGQLIKVLVWSGVAADPYEEIEVVLGSRVQQDMQFDALDSQNLYVMTENKVSMVKVAECGQYTSCEDCHGAGDPYCGWCTLENRCTQKQECNGHNEGNRWLSVDVDKCIEIMKIDPPNLPREGPRTSLTLEVARLPDGGQNYDCSFRLGSETFISHARFDNNGKLVCDNTPPPAQIPPIPVGRDHVTVDLWVRVRETYRDIVKKGFDFFDCNALKSCNPCVTSAYNCNWCVSDNKCTHNTADNCQAGSTTVGHGQSGSCPLIRQRLSEELIPAGLPKAINMSTSNVPDYADDFRCSLNINDVYVTAEATFKNGIITCSPTEYTYPQDVQEMAITLGASWRGNNIIDNPLGVTVTLYKCSSQRTDCSLCVTANPRYSCGWCEDTCTVHEVCQNRRRTWELLDCPAPIITDFIPKSGPVNGGTSVTITGINMGQRFEDIRGGVTVAGQACVPTEDEYSVSNRIVCTTGQAPTTTSGPVVVQVGGDSNKRGLSSDIFYYRNPTVLGFSPVVGPQSGGTRVQIMGELFDTGGEITARIGRQGDNMWADCIVDSSSRTNVSVECTTSSIPTTGLYTVQVLFDGHSRDAPGKFNYTDDPTIVEVSPLKSFSSGGRQLTIKGTNLRIVQNAAVRASTSGENRRKRQATERTEQCSIESDSIMKCPSPDMGQAVGDVDLTFQLDNVQISLANLPGCQDSPDRCRFAYVEDPEYFPFEEKPKLHTGGILAIEGRNLDQASFQDDVTVTIGMEICNVTSLDDDTLTCEPPENQPPGLDSEGRKSKEVLPKVEVKVGNLRFEIGELQYQIPPAGLPIWAIILIAAAGGCLVLIIIVLLFVMRSKKKEANRRYEKIMVQMDTLESNVRNECKKAFAELQTDMTDLTSDLSGHGIPFLDYRTYMMRVLFPGQDMHPVLKETNVRESRRVQWEQGMNQFSALLNNKHFLLTFIRIMEESRESFSSRDKVNVASLLTVALHGKMEYYTDILKTLLLQMIEKSVERNPKLMLRRTESVVDKMLTNWLSISLYPFLKETAGQPLFMLYKAIKYQVEKGPVDAILGFARYSITEDRLLREQVDHEVLTLNVVSLPGGPSSNMPFTVKALSCDTITQVKDKILDMAYKNIPYSKRLHADECELEWRHGRAGQLILRDSDVTSEVNHRWKKLNTLEHYKVPDSCSVALLRKPEQQMKLDRTFENLGVNQSLSSSSLAPLMQGDPEEGCRYFHLAKARDELERSNSVKRDSRFLKEQRAIPEIYLTRLLATKGTLQKFVDDAFSAILCTSPVPPSIKYFFDLLDSEAKKHGIDDPETLHIWKTNSVPLRFWVNVLKNPEFVFDIFKLGIVDACLSVIAQTFIDSCSAAEHKLGKDSPSNKLLYAREIPQYRQKVQTYYREVQQMTAVSDQEMITLLVEETKDHTHEFNMLAAVNELYDYAIKYQEQLLDALEEDTTCQRMQLAHKLENISANMEGETDV